MTIEKIRVWVGKQDIKKGRRFSITHCPVATAIRRTLKADYVAVLPNGITIRKKDKSSYYKNTLCTANKIRDFDDGKGMSPCHIIITKE